MSDGISELTRLVGKVLENQVDSRQDLIDFRQEVNLRFDNLETRVGNIEVRVGNIETELKAFRQETAENFEQLDDRNEIVTEDVMDVRSKQKRLNTRIERLESEKAV